MTVELRFPALPEHLILARLALAGIARTVPMDDELVADLKLAVTEACGNVVRHAYGDPEREQVGVRFTIVDDQLAITVEDTGAGMSAAGEDGERPATARESGMGMDIIRTIMDEVTIRPGRGGAGTVVVMKKRLAPKTEPLAAS